MTCKHCYKGEREQLACDPDYIDKFLDNIYLVNHLYFCGGEASLYVKEMKEIMEIFKRKNVPLNYVRVNSNILIRNEEFVDFLNYIGDYTTHPEEVKLIIAKDRYHLDNMQDMGIDPEQYEDTKKWYRDRLHDNVLFSEKSGSESQLLLEGRALFLPDEKKQGLLLQFFDYNKLRRTFVEPEEITDKEYKMANAFDMMCVSAEGYIYTNPDLSYESQRRNNYELSLGHVYSDTLEHMIERWNEHCDNRGYHASIYDYGMYAYVKYNEDFIEKVKKAVYSDDEEYLLRLKDEAQEQIELYKNDLDNYIANDKYKVENDMIIAALMAVSNNLSMVDTLLDIPCGFFRQCGMRVIEQEMKAKAES